MGNSNESEIRLAELIWRTVKLRVSLLGLTIVVLLVVWSSLLNGNQEAQKIDAKFCEYLVDNHNAVQRKLAEEVDKSLESRPDIPKSQPLLLSSEDQCHIGSSRNWIEITRNTDEEIPLEIPLSPSIPPPVFIVKGANEKWKAFSDYDIQRHAAYRLQIQLSSEYSASTIIINALTVAKVVPFCVFLVLAVVLILGFQQSAYRRQLRVLVRNKTGDDLSEVMAETQFFAAPFDRDPSRPEKYLAASPVDLAISALGVALILLLVGIVSTFLLNLVQLTDSIVLSYPFALYASVILLVSMMVITQKSYAEFAQPRVEHQKHDSNYRPSRESKWLTLATALIACVSLAFPWVTESSKDGDFFRGFEFLLNQRPTGELFNYKTYAFSPAIFRDVRLQVIIAVAFLAVCVLDALFGFPRTKRLAALWHQVRRLLAICVAALTVYFIFFMAFLEYESVYWVPWLDKLGYQGPASAKGYSLLYYDPAYGFWLFLVCCLFLVWLSFTTKPDGPGIWVRQLGGEAALGWKSMVEFYKRKLARHHR
jgi:hypothetical protein